MKIKKVMGIMLTVLLVLSMATACGVGNGSKSEKATSKKASDKKSETNKSTTSTDNIELYKNAVEKTKDLDSLDTIMDMEMLMVIGEEKISTSTLSNIQIINKDDSDKMEYAVSLVSQSLGQTYEMNTYYRDGYLYSNVLGDNVKAKISFDEAKDLIQESDIMDYNLLKDISVEEDGDNTIFSFTCDEKDMNDYLHSASIDSLSGVVDNVNYSFDKMEGTVTIDKNGYVKSQYLTFDMSMNYELNETAESVVQQDTNLQMTLSVNVIYNNPGEDVSIEFPGDLDTYNEVDTSELEDELEKSETIADDETEIEE